MEQKQTSLETLGHFIKSALINGTLTILPFTLTIGLFMVSFNIIIAWLRPVQSLLEHPIRFLASIPYKNIANQLFLLILGIVIFGIIIKTLLLKRFIGRLEKLLFKIPLIRPVYSGIKQLIHAFSVQDKITFKKVVLVEFPRKGLYSLGFLTSELPLEISPNSQEKFYNMFNPTTPNPSSGYFVMLSENSFKTVDLTRQEAMAMIISGGIIQPDRLTK